MSSQAEACARPRASQSHNWPQTLRVAACGRYARPRRRPRRWRRPCRRTLAAGRCRTGGAPGPGAAAGVDRTPGQVVVELAGDEDLLGGVLHLGDQLGRAVVRRRAPCGARGRRGGTQRPGQVGLGQVALGRVPPARGVPRRRAAARSPGRAGRRRPVPRPPRRGGPGPGRARCGPLPPGCAAGRGGWPARRRRSSTARAPARRERRSSRSSATPQLAVRRRSGGVQRGGDRGGTPLCSGPGGGTQSLGDAYRGAAEDDRLVDAQHAPRDGPPVVVGDRVEGGDRQLGAAGRVVEQPAP